MNRVQYADLMLTIGDKIPMKTLVTMLRMGCDKYINTQSENDLEDVANFAHLILGKMMSDKDGKDRLLKMVNRVGEVVKAEEEKEKNKNQNDTGKSE